MTRRRSASESTDEHRRRVRALLDDFLERPLASVAAPLLAARLADPDAVAADTLVGSWRVVRELGRGGMGVVCLAAGDSGLQVALKIIRQQLGLNENAVTRFRQERAILAALEHPGIARLIDEGVMADGRLWFAMELVDGIAIDAYVAMARLDVAGRLRLFAQVCEAVQHAHARSIVHRDIKPSNILVRVDATVKLLDFGIAKPQPGAEIETVRTRTGEGRLTREYASPEQREQKPVTPSSDVYSLGVLLARLLTHVPEVLEPVIARATHENPDLRYANAGELSEAIRATGR